MVELVKRARDGDADAFTKLMKSQMQNMYRTSRAILSNEEDAADAISETVLVCWEKMGHLKEDKYFRTWMTRILINKCNDILKKKENLWYTEQVPEIESADEGYQNVEWNEALQTLDEKYRLVLVLYYVDGFHTMEISKMLGIPVSTVCTRLARARKLFADSYSAKPEQKTKTMHCQPYGKERII